MGWARGAWVAVGGTGGPTHNRREAGRPGAARIQKRGLRGPTGRKWAWSTARKGVEALSKECQGRVKHQLPSEGYPEERNN